jgi:hypothetical protein
MGRKKVKHDQMISNEYLRRTTFRKRKAGLLKKLSELTTLCGIICMCYYIFTVVVILSRMFGLLHKKHFEHLKCSIICLERTEDKVNI